MARRPTVLDVQQSLLGIIMSFPEMTARSQTTTLTLLTLKRLICCVMVEKNAVIIG